MVDKVNKPEVGEALLNKKAQLVRVFIRKACRPDLNSSSRASFTSLCASTRDFPVNMAEAISTKKCVSPASLAPI